MMMIDITVAPYPKRLPTDVYAFTIDFKFGGVVEHTDTFYLQGGYDDNGSIIGQCAHDLLHLEYDFKENTPKLTTRLLDEFGEALLAEALQEDGDCLPVLSNLEYIDDDGDHYEVTWQVTEDKARLAKYGR